MRKVGIIGAGLVGAAAGYLLAITPGVREIVLVDLDQARARSEAQDIAHAAAFGGTAQIRAGDYADLAGAQVVVITAGTSLKPGQTRLDLLAANVHVVSAVLERVLRVAPETVLLFATGQAEHPEVTAEGGEVLADFRAALAGLLHELALQVVRDGEGAQKLIQVAVRGAVSDASAKVVALAIANSPLVKTAIAGEDANWGRIVMAVGKAGEPADRDRLSVAVGGTWMAREGGVVPGYDEAPVVAHMKGREIEIEVDLGLGEGSATVWTCDLTHGYIDINGSYRS